MREGLSVVWGALDGRTAPPFPMCGPKYYLTPEEYWARRRRRRLFTIIPAIIFVLVGVYGIVIDDGWQWSAIGLTVAGGIMAIVWVIHVIQYIKYDVQGDRPPPAQMQLPRYLQQPQVQQPQYPQQPLPPQQQPPPMQYPPPQQQAPNAPNANLAGAYGNNTAATTYFGGGTSSQQPTGLGLGPAKPHKPGYEAASAQSSIAVGVPVGTQDGGQPSSGGSAGSVGYYKV